MGNEKKEQKEEVVEKITLMDFCDQQGIGEVDRTALYMKYGKISEKTQADWVSELESRITLKKNDK